MIAMLAFNIVLFVLVSIGLAKHLLILTKCSKVEGIFTGTMASRIKSKVIAIFTFINSERQLEIELPKTEINFRIGQTKKLLVRDLQNVGYLYSGFIEKALFLSLGMVVTLLNTLITFLRINNEINSNYIIRVFFSLLFCVVAYKAFVGFRYAFNFAKNGNRSVGEVKSYEEGRNMDNQKIFHPIVTFFDQNGVERDFVAMQGWQSKKKIPNRINIIYIPDMPEIAEVNSFFPIWFSAFFFSTVSILSLIVVFFE